MERTGNILRKFIKDYGLEAGLTQTIIERQWRKLVGETIASHTFPDIIKGNIIFITVDTPQWMHHLSFYKQEILEKLKPYKVTKVRFKLGRLPERVSIKREIGNISLSEEDSRYIENTVNSLKDNELKERFRMLLTSVLRNKRK